MTNNPEGSMTTTRIAIAGLGAIGRAVARRLTDGLPGLSLACIATGNAAKARDWLKEQKIDCPVVELEEFPKHADLAIECAPASLIEKICRPMLEAGKQVMVLSCGALLPRPDLIDLARAHGGRIIVPTGALLGLDAVAAAAEGTIHSVKMTTRKPPIGLKGAPYLVEHNISVEGLNSSCSAAPRARPRPDFRPTSMSPPRSRSPASGRTAP
jgi:aspartate dehydrogenase